MYKLLTALLFIPTLSIQLLVENAIKHGIDLKVEGGIIKLSIEKNIF